MIAGVGIHFGLQERPAWARWAEPDDFDSSIEYRNWQTKVEKDGTYLDEIEDESLILKESARVSHGIFRFEYNPEVSDFKVIEAETLNGKTRISVSPEFIEDKPLASSGAGFDQWHQVMVAFPAVWVGSRVRIRFRVHFFKVSSPGVFSLWLQYRNAYYKAGTTRIDSALPLNFAINDPERYLDVEQTETDDPDHPHRIEVRIKKPILKIPVDETDSLLDPNSLPWVRISSAIKWADLVGGQIKAYEEVLKSPLPELYRKIADSAKAFTDPEAQMDYVTSQLADRIRYLGDWRTLKGQRIPRPLSEIAQSGFGDCKDFAASTAAILRDLGFTADVAWVWRSFEPLLERFDFPPIDSFNHAVTWVKGPANPGGKMKNYWLDATNVASYAHGIPYDISDRQALILKPASQNEEPELVDTSLNAPSEFSYRTHIKMDFSREGKDGAVHVEGVFDTAGAGPSGWIDHYYNASRNSIAYGVASVAAMSQNIADWKVDGFDLDSRIAKPLRAQLSYEDRTRPAKSSAGLAYPIAAHPVISKFLTPIDHRVSALWLDFPFHSERDVELVHLSIIGHEPLSCAVDSPWLSASRVLKENSQGVRIRDVFHLKKSYIPPNEFRGKLYHQFQQQLADCFQGATVIYRLRD